MLSHGSESRVEQRLLDLIQGRCRGLCERRTNVCRAYDAVGFVARVDACEAFARFRATGSFAAGPVKQSR